MTENIEAKELREVFEHDGASVFLHVLPEEAYCEKRIPGSRNLCVYESAFLSKIAESYPDKHTPLVVYSFDDSTREALVALEKLWDAGYLEARRLCGGLASWEAAGGAVEGDGPQPRRSLSGKYTLDTERSLIFWTGRNLFNHHYGSVSLLGGQAELKDGALVNGTFEIDMNSLRNADIPDAGMSAMLIGHLKHADFFLVDKYPTARFVAESISPIAGCTDGTNNYTVSGQFTLRGQTHPLTLSVEIAFDSEGTLAVQSVFDLDRTRWGAIYGSGKFFSRLGQHVVNDLVHLHLKLFLKPA